MAQLFAFASAAVPNPMAPPDADTLAEARRIVAGMTTNPRGPYARLRWFCKDGTVHPPQPPACRERGGGAQHGEYSEERKRLATLGWRVGTVVAALTFDELWDASNEQGRLRELPLEAYLIETRDGWVMRRARDYRGHVQAEDEEASGRGLLLRLLAEREWIERNFLLFRETVRVLPHGTAGDRGRELRRLAQSLAERERSFESLRAEVHSSPSARTSARVERWLDAYLAGPDQNADLVVDAERLVALLVESFDAEGRQARLQDTARRLADRPGLAEISQGLSGLNAGTPMDRLRRLAALSVRVRAEILGDGAAVDRLRLTDLLSDLELETRLVASEHLAMPQLSRAQYLACARELLAVAWATGYLSRGERLELDGLLAAAADGVVPLGEYQRLLRSLTFAMAWGTGTVRHAFAEALVRYSALEPAALRFVDDLLRGSALLALADALQPLVNDVQVLSGVRRIIDGSPAAGLVALNPGYARGVLRIMEEEGGVVAGRADIVLLPQTTAELPPVAGVLTRGEGNLLSHVQLLARNFGIPNVAVSEAETARLRALDGTVIEVMAGSDGSVVIRPATDRREVPATEAAEALALTVPVPDLEVRRPLTLAELSRAMSGRVVGPKAANLAELNRLFPGRVAPAIALPFGVFADHVGRGPDSILARLAEVYAAHRRGEMDADALARALTALREEIASVSLNEALLETLVPMMQAQFGEPDTYGVFVRSDTNVEDLPGFTGAGLNETVPNVRGLAVQLGAVPGVWASVLSPRAIAWRSELLTNPADVFASVLLMKSVASTKSGVMVTTDLAGRGAGLTVSTAWGVGGAVAGEAAETLTLHVDGTERLLSEAKAPYQRYLGDESGVSWRRAPAGPVLTDAEKDALRVLAGEVDDRYEPVSDADGRTLPWDIEFGFVDGELTLFQIRPLIERGQRRADRALLAAMGAARPVVEVVALDAAPVAADTPAPSPGGNGAP